MSLQGHTIWVTRPAAQADTLCQLLEDEGAQCVRFPLLEIVPMVPDEQQSHRLKTLRDIDIVIFISANAVKHVQPYLSFEALQNHVLTTLAVGKATAQQCRRVGINATVARDSDSEGLLALEVLQEEAVSGKTVAIIRGQGGRELLALTLQARGATVEYFELYRRLCPEYSHKQQLSQWLSHRPDIILLTSAETLDNLLSITPIQYHDDLLRTTLVVMSERIAENAIQHGFTGTIGVCKERSDRGLLEVCQQVLA